MSLIIVLFFVFQVLNAQNIGQAPFSISLPSLISLEVQSSTLDYIPVTPQDRDQGQTQVSSPLQIMIESNQPWVLSVRADVQNLSSSEEYIYEKNLSDFILTTPLGEQHPLSEVENTIHSRQSWRKPDSLSRAICENLVVRASGALCH